jgi:hypothetical protein
MRLKPLATMTLIGLCLLGILSCGSKGVPSREDAGGGPTVNAPKHTPEQRRQELAELLADMDRGQTFTNKQVVARLGKPDRIQQTGSKEYADRYIDTTYFYVLPPGEYTLPHGRRFTLRSGEGVRLFFDERIRHGMGGRPVTDLDDTAPLTALWFEDNEGHDLNKDGVPLRYPPP